MKRPGLLHATIPALALVVLAGCEAEDALPPVDASQAPATSKDEEPQPDVPLTAVEEKEGELGEGKGPTEPQRQPEGVPFPLPDPLPQARAISEAVKVHTGPEPLALWVGGRGTDDGQFSYPRAVTVATDGSAFIVDKSGRIQKWSPEGKLLAVVRTPAIEQGKPTGLGIDPEGNLLVADTHYCRVLVYAPDLTFLRCYGAPGREPGNFMLLTSVQAGEGGLHYVTDYGDLIARVQVFKSDGTPVRSWGTFGDGPSQFDRPMCLAVDDGRDRVYVADAVNHRISVFTREGEHVTAFGGPGKEPGELTYPYDVKLDDDGNLWVAEFGGQRVSVFSTEGESLGVWGGPGRAPPGLNRPWGVGLLPEGRLWVLDSGADRAYVLARSVVLTGQGG